MQRGNRGLSRLRTELCCIALGAALAVASVWLAYFHPGAPVPDFVFLPELYAAGLSVVLFWLRAGKSEGRERAFWQLWAFGGALSVVAVLLGFPVWPRSLRPEMDFLVLAFTFLPEVAMMAALVMRPEQVDGRLRDPVVAYEGALIALWWVYLYLLFVMPWSSIVPGAAGLSASFTGLHYFQDFILVLWLVLLARGCHGRWRRVYGHMTCAMALLTAIIGPLYQALGKGELVPATVFDALIALAFLWLALTTLVTDPSRPGMRFPERAPAPARDSRLVSITILGIPVLTLWSQFLSGAPAAVARFRLLVSFAVLVIGVLLVYRWQAVADEHSENMVDGLETSVNELRRLQGQFAEAEKLASLGQLAAGAAHEINNPVAAMLGYAELLHADPGASPRVREMGGKIGEQARRIRTLVHNLLSLGEHGNLEEQAVDVDALVRSAVELRRLDASHRHAKLQVKIEQSPLEVRGDPEKLLQVFYRLLLDLSGDDGQNAVEVRARSEPQSGCVAIEFIERAAAPAAAPAVPKLYDAQRAQKGGGLSLSVCYAIVQEHHGAIAHENLPDGRRRFRVSLPAIEHGGVAAAAPPPAAAAVARP
jgi:signal transduction histidine kinase